MSLDEDGFLDAGKTASGGPGPSMDVPLGTGVHDPLTGAVPPAHPVAQVMNVAFKAGALFFYLFGSLFALPFVFNFVVIVLCLAFDFWTVKNVTGRLLVVRVPGSYRVYPHLTLVVLNRASDGGMKFRCTGVNSKSSSSDDSIDCTGGRVRSLGL